MYILADKTLNSNTKNPTKPLYKFKKTTKEVLLSLLNNAKAYADMDDFAMSLWMINESKRTIKKLGIELEKERLNKEKGGI